MIHRKLFLAFFLVTIALSLTLITLTLSRLHYDGSIAVVAPAEQRHEPEQEWHIVWEGINKKLRTPEEVLEILKELETIVAKAEVQYDSFEAREEIIALSKMGQMDSDACKGPFIRSLRKSFETMEKDSNRWGNSLERYKQEYGRKFLTVCLRNMTDELDSNGDTITPERKGYLEELVHKCEESIGWHMMNYRYEEFSNFHYPQEIKEFGQFIEEIDTRNELAKRNGSTDQLTHIIQDVIDSSPGTHTGEKIIPYTQFSELEFLVKPENNCTTWLTSGDNSSQSPITMIIVVKSAVNDYSNRKVIRKTWALNEEVGLFKFKTVFIVGACDITNRVPEALFEQSNRVWTPENCKRTINEEARQYGDLIQTSAIDTYLNVTMKTAMMLHWVSSDCPTDFLLSIDDDYALEVTNLIRYIELLASDKERFQSSTKSPAVSTRGALKRLAQEHLYTGSAGQTTPIRAYFDIHRATYQQYPFKKYPPSIGGGLILMSHKTARTFYLASHFVRFLAFDDIYMGILAYKLGVRTRPTDHFQCDPQEYLKSKPINPDSTKCIGVHRIKPDDLIDLWNHRRQSTERLTDDGLISNKFLVAS